MSLENDTSHSEEVEARAIAKLEQLLDAKKLDFDEEEIAILKRVIIMVRGLDAFGSMASFVKNTLIWLGVIVSSYIAVKNGVIDMIIAVVSNTKG